MYITIKHVKTHARTLTLNDMWFASISIECVSLIGLIFDSQDRNETERSFSDFRTSNRYFILFRDALPAEMEEGRKN